MKCKGCAGEVEYVPLAEVAIADRFAAGPALTHYPTPPCQWFTDTPAVQILAYINVAVYKTKSLTEAEAVNETEIDRYFAGHGTDRPSP